MADAWDSASFLLSWSTRGQLSVLCWFLTLHTIGFFGVFPVLLPGSRISASGNQNFCMPEAEILNAGSRKKKSRKQKKKIGKQKNKIAEAEKKKRGSRKKKKTSNCFFSSSSHFLFSFLSQWPDWLLLTYCSNASIYVLRMLQVN